MQEGKKKEFEIRGFDPESNLVNPEAKNLVVTKNNLIRICNGVSDFYRRKLSDNEVNAVNTFIMSVPVKKIVGLPRDQQISTLVSAYVNHAHVYNDQINASGFVDLSNPDLPRDYMKFELGRRDTNSIYNTNSLKITQPQNYRNNTIVPGLENFDVKYLNPASADKTGRTSQNGGHVVEALDKIFGGKNVVELLNEGSQIFSNYNSLVLRHHVISFDSRNRKILEFPIDQPFTNYAFTLNFSADVGSQGTVRVQQILQNIVSMQINNIKFPVRDSPNINSITLYSNIRVLVKELLGSSAQYDVMNFDAGLKQVESYHFDFVVQSIVDGFAILVPANRPAYKFNIPITRLESLNFVFYDPVYPIVSPADRIFVAITARAINFSTFTILPTGTPHNLLVGDLLYFNIDLAYSGAALVQAKNLNSPQGVQIINVPTPSTFDVLIPLLALPVLPASIAVFIGPRRVIIEMEFTSKPEQN